MGSSGLPMLLLVMTGPQTSLVCFLLIPFEGLVLVEEYQSGTL